MNAQAILFAGLNFTAILDAMNDKATELTQGDRDWKHFRAWGLIKIFNAETNVYATYEKAHSQGFYANGINPSDGVIANYAAVVAGGGSNYSQNL
ncbi:MAG: hypothetical protein LBG64_00255 [Pseudomonadales bacterium]|jgi:hypothetical protein|nr:hypothetical protein [Pseudomonadales bacterium]